MLIGYSPNTTATISTTVANAWNNGNEAVALVWVGINIAISAIVLIAINIFETREKGVRL